MQKHLSLCAALLAITFIINAGEVSAQNSTNVDASANIRTSNTGAKIDARVNLDAKRLLIEAEIEAKRKALRSESEENRAEVRQEITEKRQEIQAEIKSAREAATQRMIDLRAQVATERDPAKMRAQEARISGREKALQRFDAAVLRISALKDKINTQIDRLEAKGVDVTNAENFMATVDINLSDAKTKIVEANALLSISIEELSKDARTELVALTKEIQALLREAHQAENSAVKSLKDAIKVQLEATATVEAEANQ